MLEWNDDFNSILKRAINVYGNEKQLDMVNEECAELIKSVCKAIRYSEKIDEKNIKLKDQHLFGMVDEFADIIIMIKQMIIHFDIQKEFNGKVKFKLDRLNDRLNKFVENCKHENKTKYTDPNTFITTIQCKDCEKILDIVFECSHEKTTEHFDLDEKLIYVKCEKCNRIIEKKPYKVEIKEIDIIKGINKDIPKLRKIMDGKGEVEIE